MQNTSDYSIEFEHNYRPEVHQHSLICFIHKYGDAHAACRAVWRTSLKEKVVCVIIGIGEHWSDDTKSEDDGFCFAAYITFNFIKDQFEFKYADPDETPWRDIYNFGKPVSAVDARTHELRPELNNILNAIVNQSNEINDYLS